MERAIKYTFGTFVAAMTVTVPLILVVIWSDSPTDAVWRWLSTAITVLICSGLVLPALRARLGESDREK